MKKKLQRDFTTQEQSLRLLELGVPADSANCTLKKRIEDGGYSVCWISYIEDFIGPVKVDSILPCWSVGRLIEIDRICSTLPEEQYMFPFWYDIQDNVEWAIRVLESGIRTGNIDFSKLEE